MLVIVQLFSMSAHADDGLKWSELRVYLSSNSFSSAPTALNNLTAADNVKKLSDLTGMGLEADAQVKPWLKVGTKFRGIWNAVNQPNPPSPATAYIQITQYSAGLLARGTILEKDWIQADLFAELGLANTKIDVLTSVSGKGTFTKDSGLYQRAGISVGLGSPTFKFFVEAGQEWNNLSSVSFTGTLVNNISSVDFTGPYYAAGLIIYGIPSWIKPGGITTSK